MNKKMLTIVVGSFFVLAIIIFLSNLETISAQECRIIKIHGRTERPSIMLEPETIFLSQGDCVVWFNRFKAEDIKVTFKKGPVYLDKKGTSKNTSMGFTLNAQSCYVSDWIPFTGTASFGFLEKGTYEYSVEAKNIGGVKAEGWIVVE